MRFGLFLAALLLAGGLPAAPASAQHCLSETRWLEGELTQVRKRTAGGRLERGLVLDLGKPSCAQVTDTDGVPARLESVQTLQVVASTKVRARELERLVGSRVKLAGYLDAPDPQHQLADAVLVDAEIVAAEEQSFDVAEGEDEAVAAPSGAGQAEAYAPPADPAQSDTETRLANFVTNFYLSGNNISPELMRGIYARKVTYFGKPKTPVASIVKDKLNYYARWPSRQYTLRPGTLQVRRLGLDSRVYDISFIYDFRLASAAKSSSGTGYGRLQIDLGDGRGKIIRESGKVIDRN